MSSQQKYPDILGMWVHVICHCNHRTKFITFLVLRGSEPDKQLHAHSCSLSPSFLLIVPSHLPMFPRKDVYLSQEITLIEKFPLLGSTELSLWMAQDPHSFRVYRAYIIIIQSCQDWQNLGNWSETMPQQKLELESPTVSRLMCE